MILEKSEIDGIKFYYRPGFSDKKTFNEVIGQKTYLKKGNIDNCFWQKTTPTIKEIQSESFREIEVQRIIKTGAWIAIKDTVFIILRTLS